MPRNWYWKAPKPYAKHKMRREYLSYRAFYKKNNVFQEKMRILIITMFRIPYQV